VSTVGHQPSNKLDVAPVMASATCLQHVNRAFSSFSTYPFLLPLLQCVSDILKLLQVCSVPCSKLFGMNMTDLVKGLLEPFHLQRQGLLSLSKCQTT